MGTTERKIRSLAASGVSACVGIDLAGVEHRETGIAVLVEGRLVLLTSAASAPAGGETIPLPNSQSTVLYLQATSG